MKGKGEHELRVRSRLMAPWLVGLLDLLVAGSSSGWWGLACPAHCSSSLGLWAAIFVAGSSFGALCTLFCLRDLLIREDLLRREPPARVVRPPRGPSSRLSGYLDE